MHEKFFLFMLFLPMTTTTRHIEYVTLNFRHLNPAECWPWLWFWWLLLLSIVIEPGFGSTGMDFPGLILMRTLLPKILNKKLLNWPVYFLLFFSFSTKEKGCPARDSHQPTHKPTNTYKGKIQLFWIKLHGENGMCKPLTLENGSKYNYSENTL